MKIVKFGIVMVGILSLCRISAMGAAGVRSEGDHILLENDHVVYAVGTDGLNKAFVNKRTGRDHLDSAKNLLQHRALGAWGKGDNSGVYRHFAIESGRQNVRDYYVHLDFTGWKYVQMPESAGGKILDFKFPLSNYYALGNMSFESVDRVYVFITTLPPGATVGAHFGGLEALQETPRTLHNPSLQVNEKSITFPITLEPDWYLEYEGDGPVRVFDPNGFTKAKVEPQGVVPTIQKGDNDVMFFCDQGQDQGQTAKVMFITRGKPLR